jgi:GTP-binding protein EngB required for normal cell division
VDCSTLAKSIERLNGFLDSEGPDLLGASDNKAFQDQAMELLAKTKLTKFTIVMGFVGGTGVGKSTLINALAQREISLASDRRPYTDRAVLYRHQDAITSFYRGDELFREPDATHQIDIIRDLIIVDLPDFDSHDNKNEQTTLKILPNLDMIIWVVSPEKYANATFFEFIKKSNSHQNNFSFVFNKSDQLLDNKCSDKYSRLKEALGDFIFHLKTEAKINNPRVFYLSGHEEFSTILKDKFLSEEFSRFREFIMARRNSKEVESIKFLNLFHKSRRLFDRIYEQAKPDLKLQAIQTVAEITQENDWPKVMGSNELNKQKISSAIFEYLLRTDNSISSVKLVMRLLTGRFYVENEGYADQVSAKIREVLATLSGPWIERISSIEARINSEAMLGSLGRISQTKPNDFVVTGSNVVDEFLTLLSKKTDPGAKKISSIFLRFIQILILCIPLGLLFVRFSGQDSIMKIFNDFDLIGSVWALIALASGLFGPDGFTALLALVLVELLLITWLSGRRIKKLRKRSDYLAIHVLNVMDKAVESQAKQISREIKGNVERISNSVNKLYRIKQLFCSRMADPPIDEKV